MCRGVVEQAAAAAEAAQKDCAAWKAKYEAALDRCNQAEFKVGSANHSACHVQSLLIAANKRSSRLGQLRLQCLSCAVFIEGCNEAEFKVGSVEIAAFVMCQVHRLQQPSRLQSHSACQAPSPVAFTHYAEQSSAVLATAAQQIHISLVYLILFVCTVTPCCVSCTSRVTAGSKTPAVAMAC